MRYLRRLMSFKLLVILAYSMPQMKQLKARRSYQLTHGQS